MATTSFSRSGLWDLVIDQDFDYEDPAPVKPGELFSIQQRELFALGVIYCAVLGLLYFGIKFALYTFWPAFSEKFDDKDRFKICNSAISSLLVSPIVTAAYAPAWWSCAWSTEDRFTKTCPWVIRAFVLHGAISVFEIGGYIFMRDLNPVKYLHHFCALIFLVAGLGQSQVHFFIYTGGLLEGSNFFLGIFYIQRVLKNHRLISAPVPGRAEVINGVCLWFAYLIFRILPLLYSAFSFYQDSMYEYEFSWNAPGRRQWLLQCGVVGHFFLSLLSVMWFAQISSILFQGIVSSLQRPPKQVQAAQAPAPASEPAQYENSAHHKEKHA